MEVTSALTVPDENDITGIQQALGIYNKSGIIGDMSWIGRYWGAEGKLPCSVLLHRQLVFVYNFIASHRSLVKSLVTMLNLLSLSSSNLVLLLLLLLFAVETL